MLVIRKLFEIMFQWHHYSIYIHQYTFFEIKSFFNPKITQKCNERAQIKFI